MTIATARPAQRRAGRGSDRLHNRRLKLLAWLLLCALPGVGVTYAWLDAAVAVPAVLYVVSSLLALALYRHDKRQAGMGGRRVAEKWLHAVELLGGWPGALWAQQRYRHKTRKLSFIAVLWLIVALHQAGWAAWLWHAGHLSALSWAL